MVHFSGKTRKMNHLSSFCASEASAKVPFNAYFEFMYGFKSHKISSVKVVVIIRKIRKIRSLK
ncbi:MAG: hypothetical protein U5L45_23270 [Saprospiraceae bacterium]|nr:hypothetical protein [Saprospiraceae bacterium]